MAQSSAVGSLRCKLITQASQSNQRRSGAYRAAFRIACQHGSSDTPSIDRRAAILSLGAALVASSVSPSMAASEGYVDFYGTASPPTSYGGYGGNAIEDARYTFEYPDGWKSIVPNKVEKGTQGIDCRVFNPRNKQEQVFVITFGRAGEDNKSFRLTDIESTFAGFAGADADMQDAVSMATNTKTGDREINGQKYFDIDVESPDVTYLSSVTVNFGKVYAIFVKVPSRTFKAEEEKLRHIINSFRTI